ncbi:MAG: glycosyltransferase family 39 protein [Candidatus Sulfotelmatobacter sp.]
MDARPRVTAARERTSTLLFNSWAKIRTAQFWMVAIALLLRVGWIVVGGTYKSATVQQKFGFGWEMGYIGAAIASGHGFSNPFLTSTGPTAWEPPLYPYLVAGVFHTFGIYSEASAFVLLTINSIFSALTCIPIFLIARRIFSERVAVASAWTWALLPYAMTWCTHWVWETSLSAFLLGVIFWCALTLEEGEGLKPWLWFGLLWGVAALSSPALLAFLPASGLWAWYRRSKRRKPSLVGVVLATSLFIAIVAPWTVRNYQTFGKFIFIRDNFGAELRLGNGPRADGTWMEYLHPIQDTYAMRQYTAMGELGYINVRKRQALDYIKADYGRFAVLCLKRFIYFWNGPPKEARIWWLAESRNSIFLASSVMMFWGLGRALRQRRPGAWLLFWLILLYPAAYYVVFPGQRYRHPIEPEITILGVFLLSEVDRKSQAGRNDRDGDLRAEERNPLGS